jgi:hypothetical protein
MFLCKVTEALRSLAPMSTDMEEVGPSSSSSSSSASAAAAAPPPTVYTLELAGKEVSFSSATPTAARPAVASACPDTAAGEGGAGAGGGGGGGGTRAPAPSMVKGSTAKSVAGTSARKGSAFASRSKSKAVVSPEGMIFFPGRGSPSDK